MWKLNKIDHQIFPRNPLRTVVFAVEFEPILRISEGKEIADFQDKIRDRFPRFQKGESLEVKFDGVGQVDARQETGFEFGSVDEQIKVSLWTRRISREARTHLSKDILLEDVDRIVEALRSTYAPIHVKRIGLRYINLIDKNLISEALGKSVNWSDLVSAQFINLPKSLVDIEDAQFANELHSSMERGAMSLRYGLRQNAQLKSKLWHFDIDRYCSDRIDIGDAKDLADMFASDIYCLFMTAVGVELRNWMNLPYGS